MNSNRRYDTDNYEDPDDATTNYINVTEIYKQANDIKNKAAVEENIDIKLKLYEQAIALYRTIESHNECNEICDIICQEIIPYQSHNEQLKILENNPLVLPKKIIFKKDFLLKIQYLKLLGDAYFSCKQYNKAKEIYETLLQTLDSVNTIGIPYESYKNSYENLHNSCSNLRSDILINLEITLINLANLGINSEINLGNTYYTQKQYDRARQKYDEIDKKIEEFHEKNPENIKKIQKLRIKLGHSYNSLGDYSKASIQYIKANPTINQNATYNYATYNYNKVEGKINNLIKFLESQKKIEPPKSILKYKPTPSLLFSLFGIKTSVRKGKSAAKKWLLARISDQINGTTTCSIDDYKKHLPAFQDGKLGKLIQENKQFLPPELRQVIDKKIRILDNEEKHKNQAWVRFGASLP